MIVGLTDNNKIMRRMSKEELINRMAELDWFIAELKKRGRVEPKYEEQKEKVFQEIERKDNVEYFHDLFEYVEPEEMVFEDYKKGPGRPKKV